MIGRVVSVKMQKTIAVLVEGKKTHPLYKKTYVWSKKYLVHDEIGCKLGDVVEIASTKPISRRKHFLVTKIIGKDLVALGEEAMKLEAQEAIAEVMPEEKAESEATEVTKVSKEPEVIVKSEEKVSKAGKVSKVSKGKTAKKQEEKGGKE